MILLANASNMLRSDMSLVLGFIKALVTPLPSEALEFYNLKYLVAWQVVSVAQHIYQWEQWRVVWPWQKMIEEIHVVL